MNSNKAFKNKIQDMQNKKTRLGQFYTTNYDYILQNMIIPDNITTIIEPFAGNCDLLNFLKNKNGYNIELYDIDPKNDETIKQDTLENPPCYDNKFVLTNPPYLARNKNTNKHLYDKYNCNDLYKCFILNIIDSNCIGGIIIIPLNFICSIRKADIDLRKNFLKKFTINILNIFEEKVFDDTSYAVCSLYFTLKTTHAKITPIKTFIYPSNKIINIKLSTINNYTIGGEIYKLPQTKQYKIERATTKTLNTNITNITLKCIDDSITSKIRLLFVLDKDRFIDTTTNLSARSYATLVITPHIKLSQQKDLVEKFNLYLEEQRETYNSLFLTNYRESNTIARKRISFELAFNICNYLL